MVESKAQYVVCSNSTPRITTSTATTANAWNLRGKAVTQMVRLLPVKVVWWDVTNQKIISFISFIFPQI